MRPSGLGGCLMETGTWSRMRDSESQSSPSLIYAPWLPRRAKMTDPPSYHKINKGAGPLRPETDDDAQQPTPPIIGVVATMPRTVAVQFCTCPSRTERSDPWSACRPPIFIVRHLVHAEEAEGINNLRQKNGWPCHGQPLLCEGGLRHRLSSPRLKSFSHFSKPASIRLIGKCSQR